MTQGGQSFNIETETRRGGKVEERSLKARGEPI